MPGRATTGYPPPHGIVELLTVAYMTGLVFRPRRQYARMGIDSVAAVALYVVGIAGLATMAT